jgi:hypothetical protein
MDGETSAADSAGATADADCTDVAAGADVAGSVGDTADHAASVAGATSAADRVADPVADADAAADVDGGDGEAASSAGWLASLIRSESLAIAAIEARRLALVAQLADVVTVDAVAMLTSLPRVPGALQDHEVIESAVTAEVQAVLGIAQGPAIGLVELARRLSSVLPTVLAALREGRLDLARVLAEGTAVLPDTHAREVAELMLGVAGVAPWEGLSPRAWRARVDRAVVRADADAARRRRREAYERRAVRVLASIAGMAELFITADAADVAMATQVLTDLATRRPATGADGGYVTMDQRRVDAFVEVFRKIRDGHPLPGVSVRREREIGLVLHADTFFGHGPAAEDPAEVRGLSGHTVLDPFTAREQAHAAVHGTAGPAGPDRPAGTDRAAGPAGTVSKGGRPGAVNVLLVDWAGVLQRVVRLATPPAGGWTRQLLDAAVRARLSAFDTPAGSSCESYAPTVAVSAHVQARNPRCTGYDCPRPAGRCDLDHDTPWPRGPTTVTNLAPRCRRHHEHKARGLVHTTLHCRWHGRDAHAHRHRRDDRP